MELARTPNCCAAGLIHGLGNAHFVGREKDFKAFAEKLFTITNTKNGRSGTHHFYYAFTNSNQGMERDWLIKLGFSDDKIAGIHYHTVDNNHLRKYYATVFAEEIKAEEERKKKEMEERQKAAEEARRVAAEKKEQKRLERLANKGPDRKPGEFRVGDSVYQWCRDGSVGLNRFGTRRRHGEVIAVNEDGTIDIREKRGDRRITRLTPIVSNGHREGNIQRKERPYY